MNNEEKILALLEQVVTDVSGLKATVASLEVRVDETAALAQRTAVLLENDVAHKINLLYEGHKTIMDKLDDLTSTKSRVEMLEADMTMMKDAYKLLRQEVNELKKAQ